MEITKELKEELMKAGLSKHQCESTIITKLIDYGKPEGIINLQNEVEDETKKAKLELSKLAQSQSYIENRCNETKEKLYHFEEMVTEKINEKVNSVSFDNENISDEAKELLTLFTRMISVTGNKTEAYKSISYILWAFYTRSSNVPSIFTSDNDVALKEDKKEEKKDEQPIRTTRVFF